MSDPTFETTCPCCGARITIDTALHRVIAHEASPKRRQSADLDRLNHAADVLAKQAERREAHFRESTEDEKVKTDLLSRKFEEALKRTRDQPVKPSLRDIDLD